MLKNSCNRHHIKSQKVTTHESLSGFLKASLKVRGFEAIFFLIMALLLIFLCTHAIM